jgi:uncharacterized RDD family membrane protein YckC
MSITHRVVGVVLFLTLIGCFYVSRNQDQIGFGSHESGDKVEVSAGSHPAAIVWAVLVICLYVVLLKKDVRAKPVGPASMVRRFLSLLIDFFIVVIATSSVVALIPLEVEARRVGHFEWSFARNYMVSTDSVITPLALLGLIELFLYVVYPLTRGKQTIGQYVMRVKVLPPFGTEGRFTWNAAIKRVWHSFLGACKWRFKLDHNGQTRADRETGCTVSLVEYKRGDADTSS